MKAFGWILLIAGLCGCAFAMFLGVLEIFVTGAPSEKMLYGVVELGIGAFGFIGAGINLISN